MPETLRVGPLEVDAYRVEVRCDGRRLDLTAIERYEGERKAMLADVAHELRTPLAATFRVDPSAAQPALAVGRRAGRSHGARAAGARPARETVHVAAALEAFELAPQAGRLDGQAPRQLVHRGRALQLLQDREAQGHSANTAQAVAYATISW
jgi:signal transduction histidine kinase